jgi:hypothetical protein
MVVALVKAPGKSPIAIDARWMVPSSFAKK